MTIDDIKKYLPSKKIQYLILALVVVGILIIGGSFLFKKLKKVKNPFLDVSLVDESSQNSDLVKDTDEDGAYDWEELRAGLDPEEAYSNGNGILDGIYLDELKRRERARFVSAGGASLTETEKFLRSGLTAVIAFEQSGGIFNENNQAQFDRNIEQYITTLPLGGKIYLKEDIKRVDNTYTKMKTYESTMKQALKAYPINASDFELLVVAAEDNTNYSGKLYVTSEKYKKYLNELVAVEVPQSVTETHLRLLNNVSNLSASLENLLSKEPDDVVIISSILQMETMLNNTISAIEKVNRFFEAVETSSPEDMDQTEYEEEPEEGVDGLPESSPSQGI